jgi:hypothetical protein
MSHSEAIIKKYIQLLIQTYDLDEQSLLDIWQNNKSIFDEELKEDKPQKEDYSKKSLAELKQLCKDKGLKCTGTKAVLIERLQTETTTQTTLVSKLKKTSRNNSGTRISNVLQKIIHNSNTVNIRRNTFGLYEHPDTGFIFDEKTHEVIGKQSESIDPETNAPTVEKLTEQDIELCKEYNFNYRIPETISVTNH